jgi:hypothetical protein
MSAKGGTALCLDVEAGRALILVGMVDKMESGVHLACADERGGIEMARVVVRVIESEIALGIEECGPRELGVETGPDERRETLSKLREE